MLLAAGFARRLLPDRRDEVLNELAGLGERVAVTLASQLDGGQRLPRLCQPEDFVVELLVIGVRAGEIDDLGDLGENADAIVGELMERAPEARGDPRGCAEELDGENAIGGECDGDLAVDGCGTVAAHAGSDCRTADMGEFFGELGQVGGSEFELEVDGRGLVRLAGACDRGPLEPACPLDIGPGQFEGGEGIRIGFRELAKADEDVAGIPAKEPDGLGDGAAEDAERPRAEAQQHEHPY